MYPSHPGWGYNQQPYNNYIHQPVPHHPNHPLSSYTQPHAPQPSTSWSSSEVTNLPALNRAIRNIPTSEINHFKTSSTDTLATCNDNSQTIHVYHILASRDELLLLAAVIQRLKTEEHKTTHGPALIIVVEDLKNPEGEDRVQFVLDLVQTITGKPATRQSADVCAFGLVIVIANRAGPAPASDNPTTTTTTHGFPSVSTTTATAAPSPALQTWLRAITTTITTTIAAILGLRTALPTRRATVWHNAAWLPLLMYLLTHEARHPQCSLAALTIRGTLGLDARHIRARTPAIATDLAHIAAAAAALGIPLVLLDDSGLETQKVKYLADMPGLRRVWPALLPQRVWGRALMGVMNAAVVGVVRVRAGVYGRDGEAVAGYAGRVLKGVRSSGAWVGDCVRKERYGAEVCGVKKAAGELGSLAGMCDMPVLEWASALLGLLVAPAGCTGGVNAVRCKVDFEGGSLRLDAAGGVYIVMPAVSPEEVEKGLLKYWGMFLASVGKGRGVKIAKGIASAWLDMAKVLEAQLVAVMRDPKAQSWEAEEKKGLVKTLKALREGAMTQICKKSLEDGSGW